jgi:hypothetical protein
MKALSEDNPIKRGTSRIFHIILRKGLYLSPVLSHTINMYMSHVAAADNDDDDDPKVK